MQRKRFFTSESVTEGHPDKICDQISDAILDNILDQDKNARVACEVTANGNNVTIMGEITANAAVDFESIARETIRKIGYTDIKSGISPNECNVKIDIKEQSRDIALGVDNSVEFKSDGDAGDKIGAGDQGMMFGYACNETNELMPLPIEIAHKIAERLSEVRKNGEVKGLLPDGKCQVTVEYDGFKPKRIDAIVVSAQHKGDKNIIELKDEIIKKVIHKVVPSKYLDEKTRFFINETGRFETGGPAGDCGLTGRKIIVDTYGGYCSHGGGAFSGKDPTKVDRSGAYMARYICKNLVKAGLADRIQLSVSYVIGVAHPVSVFIDTFGTGKVEDEKIQQIVNDLFDFRPAKIIEKLELRRAIYFSTSVYGHFGKSYLPWEQTDMVEEIKKKVEEI